MSANEMVCFLGRLSRFLERGIVRASGRFDAAYYLENNPDVAAAACDPVDHFCVWGWKEMRNPSAGFDSHYYATHYPDARKHAVNPIVHWVLFGAWRGKSTNYPETVAFLKSADPAWRDYKLVFVVHDCSRTGAPIFLLRLLQGMTGNGTINPSEIGLIILANGPLLSEFSTLCNTLLLWLVPEAEKQNRVRRFVGRNPARLLYLNSIAAARVLTYVCDDTAQLLCHVHEMPILAAAFEKECQLLARHCHRYIAVSEQSVTVIKDMINLPTPNVNVIHPGVPIRHRQKKPAFSGRVIRILGCGTASRRKGTDIFCDVAEALAGLGVAFEMRWAGARGDVDIASRIASGHLYGRLMWVGEQEDMSKLFDWADVLLMPSREDPFPLVVLEAAERGVPTICFDEQAGGIHMVVRQGAGIVVPYLDVQEITMAVVRFVDQPTLLELLGNRAREIVVRDFNMDNVLQSITIIIERLRGSVASRVR